jgi:hypothetical protein
MSSSGYQPVNSRNRPKGAGAGGVGAIGLLGLIGLAIGLIALGLAIWALVWAGDEQHDERKLREELGLDFARLNSSCCVNGEVGARGPRGFTGNNGTNGINGSTGPAGINGNSSGILNNGTAVNQIICYARFYGLTAGK